MEVSLLLEAVLEVPQALLPVEQTVPVALRTSWGKPSSSFYGPRCGTCCICPMPVALPSLQPIRMH